MNKHPARWMPTCKEVHRLVSEGMDRDLSLLERIRVRFHLLICAACQTFDGQMRLLRQAMRKLPSVDSTDATTDASRGES